MIFVPNILRGVENIDMSVTVMEQELAMPIYCSPTALQRIFHHEGENAVAAAANKYGTLFGVSSLGTASLTEIRAKYNGPQCYQFYFHKDRGLNKVMLENAKQAGVDVMHVDSRYYYWWKQGARFKNWFCHTIQLNVSWSLPVRD